MKKQTNKRKQQQQQQKRNKNREKFNGLESERERENGKNHQIVAQKYTRAELLKLTLKQDERITTTVTAATVAAAAAVAAALYFRYFICHVFSFSRLTDSV